MSSDVVFHIKHIDACFSP
uniref:Uncharacterized protein n=1 Tax=Arundo donax TaxID=35708 RepID=A0A0A9A735_ARUDO